MSRDKTHSSVDTPENLFTIEGIDTGLGLNRSGGRVKFYKQVLASFLDNKKFTDQYIKHLLSLENKEEAIRAFHTLKGAAGTIGAIKLQALTAEIEALLSEAPACLSDQLINDFQKSLIQVIEGIHKAILQEPDAKLQPSTISTTELLTRLEEMLPYIDLCEASVTTKVKDLMAQINDSAQLTFLKQLEEYIRQYDFDAAAIEINKFIRVQQNA